MDAARGSIEGCPLGRTAARGLLGRTNRDWWPDSLPLDVLHQGGVRPIRWATTSTMPRRSRRSTTRRSRPTSPR